MSSQGSPLKPPDEIIPFWGKRSHHVPSSGGNSQSTMITPAIVAVLIFLTAAFIAVSYYRVFGRYCHILDRFFWRRRRDIFESTDVESGRISSAKGLDEALIKKIPTYTFKSKKGLPNCTECVICLSEFRDCEKLRLLPKCSHAFHIRCIDMWLHSHPNCPLCRAPIISQTSVPPVQRILPASRRTPDAVAPQTVQAEHNSVDHEASQAPPSSRNVEDVNENAEANSRDHEEEARVLSQMSQNVRSLTRTCSHTENAHGDESSLPRRRDYPQREHLLPKHRRSNSTGSYFQNPVDAAFDQEIWHKRAQTSGEPVDDLSSALRIFADALSVLMDSPPFSKSCDKAIEPLSNGIVQLGSSSSIAVSLTDQTSSNLHDPQTGSQVEAAQEAGERSKPIGASHKLEIRELSSFSKPYTMKRSFSGSKLFQLLQSKRHL